MTFSFLVPFPVLRSVVPSGMLEGGKAVPVVIGGGLWFSVRRLAVWWLVAWSDLDPLPCRFFGGQVALSDWRSAAVQTFRRKISRQVFKKSIQKFRSLIIRIYTRTRKVLDSLITHIRVRMTHIITAYILYVRVLPFFSIPFMAISKK